MINKVIRPLNKMLSPLMKLIEPMRESIFNIGMIVIVLKLAESLADIEIITPYISDTFLCALSSAVFGAGLGTANPAMAIAGGVGMAVSCHD